MKIPIADQPIDRGLTDMCRQGVGGLNYREESIDEAHVRLAGGSRLGDPCQTVKAPKSRPPIISAELTATGVSLGDYEHGRRKELTVHLVLRREAQDCAPQGPMMEDVHEIRLRLNDSFCGKFHAGQKFVLTIAPAAEE